MGQRGRCRSDGRRVLTARRSVFAGPYSAASSPGEGFLFLRGQLVHIFVDQRGGVRRLPFPQQAFAFQPGKLLKQTGHLIAAGNAVSLPSGGPSARPPAPRSCRRRSGNAPRRRRDPRCGNPGRCPPGLPPWDPARRKRWYRTWRRPSLW